MSEPETPRDVHDILNAAKPEYIYRVNGGKIIRAEILARGGNGWHHVELEDGTTKNMQLTPNCWDRCPIVACELHLQTICYLYTDSRKNATGLLPILKTAIHMLETCDPRDPLKECEPGGGGTSQ